MRKHDFYYRELAGIIIEAAKDIKASHRHQEELWAAAEEALWLAKVPPSAQYSPLSYTILYRGIIGFLRKDATSFIETIEFPED